LQQVFWNVLKNAVKFTPSGGKITIETDTRADARRWRVIISDTGHGLTPEELQRAFAAFAQGEHATSKPHRFGGLGLGLAISRTLVELHSGEIRVTSAGRDQGATFTIELPLSQKVKEKSPAIKSPPTKKPSAPDRAKSGRRILLVEDHEPTRTALSHLLIRRGYEVKSAGSLAEARALAKQHRFHLLISDIGLPDGHGFDLMTELQADHPELRGIALTGYGMDEDIARSRNAGFASHLIKPVRVQSLEEALARAFAEG
jgi:CheY-like chemotaxis protein/anti-sigma regulatory factor (Ser/Thr protein kinase)